MCYSLWIMWAVGGQGMLAEDLAIDALEEMVCPPVEKVVGVGNIAAGVATLQRAPHAPLTELTSAWVSTWV